VNVSIPEGWYPEFVQDRVNRFVIPNTEVTEHKFQQDEKDAHNTYALLENVVIPLCYDQPVQWLSVIDSKRLATEYYEQLYLGNKE
jgi:glycogen phosphorylase